MCRIVPSVSPFRLLEVLYRLQHLAAMAKYITGFFDKAKVTFDILKQNGGVRGKHAYSLNNLTF